MAVPRDNTRFTLTSLISSGKVIRIMINLSYRIRQMLRGDLIFNKRDVNNVVAVKQQDRTRKNGLK